MRAKYKLIRSHEGRFSWRLFSGNHRVLLSGASYATVEQAAAAIERCRCNATVAARFRRDRAATGEPCFSVLDEAGNVVGRSEVYLSDGARDRGMDAVRTNAPTPVQVEALVD